MVNNLTGRLRYSLDHCPILDTAIAAQLLRNGKYESADLESTRLVSREASDRWRTPTLINISGDFTAAEFAAAPKIQSRLKLRNTA